MKQIKQHQNWEDYTADFFLTLDDNDNILYSYYIGPVGDSKDLCLYSVYVNDKYRELGLFNKLMKEVLTYVKFKCIFLLVKVNINHFILEKYNNMGFEFSHKDDEDENYVWLIKNMLIK